MKRALAQFLLRLSNSLDNSRAYAEALAHAVEIKLAQEAGKTVAFFALEREQKAKEQLRAILEPVPETQGTPHWTPENATALRQFLESAPGKDFSTRLATVVAAVAINGARNTANTVHAAGISAGWDEAVRYILNLSRVSGVQDTNQNDETPRGETELLEQLSP